MCSIDIKEYLNLFVKTIIELEDLLADTYHIESAPYIVAGKEFPKQGLLVFKNRQTQFLFHGGGVTFHVGTEIYDYDILSSKKHCIKISPWKFNQFLKTATAIRIHDDDLIPCFNTLEKSGVLIQLPEGANCFEINMDAIPDVS